MTAREIVADAAVIGRGPLCAELGSRASRGLASVLVAPAGRGKSALLAVAAEAWDSQGLPVLSLTAAPADTAVPYAVVAELFATLGNDCPCLEGPQKSAVRWVLREEDGPEPDLAAVRLAALSCATKLSEQGRILLIADDLQWWDPKSAEVLAFVARRARGWLTVVAATRPDGRTTAVFPGREAVDYAVPPLTISETAALLDGRAIPHRLAARVHSAAGGNPRLVIEIARGLDGSADALDQGPVTSPSAQRTIRGWLAELPEAVWQVLLVAAVAADPAASTLRRAAGPAALDTLAAAVRAELIAVDANGMLTFPATAVRETLLADASEQTLRNAHRLLADVSPNPADRLWHAASARKGPDAGIVRALTAAAAGARRRGERGRAAELALLAAEMVPTGSANALWRASGSGGGNMARGGTRGTAAGGRTSVFDGAVPASGGSAAEPAAGSAIPPAGCALPEADGSVVGATSATSAASPIAMMAALAAQAAERIYQPGIPGPSAADPPSAWSSAAIHTALPYPIRPIRRDVGSAPPTLLARPAPESTETLLLAAAVDAGAAGRLDLAWTALARLDSSGADHTARVRARIAVVDAVGQALAGLDALLAQALADAETAGDPALLSAVHLRLAWHAHLALGRNDQAHRSARAAVRWAEQSTDSDALAGALVMTARIQQLLGLPECSATLRRALALGCSPRPGGLVNSPQWTAVRFAVFADRLDEARHHLRTLAPRAERSGSSEDLRMVLCASIEIEARSGNGTAARRLADRVLALPGAETASPGPAWYAAALAELAGGTLKQALRYAELGSESSAQEQDIVFLTRSLQITGMVRLLLRDAAGAVDDLRRVSDLIQRQGVHDPATVRYHADLAEAHVALGEFDEAADLIAATREAAAALGRRGVLASLDRAEGVRRAAIGDFARAEALLLRAERTFGKLGLPLEQARVLLAQSVTQKRQRRAARSRTAYQTAADTFARCGAELWAPHLLDHGRPAARSAATNGSAGRRPSTDSAAPDGGRTSLRPTWVGGGGNSGERSRSLLVQQTDGGEAPAGGRGAAVRAPERGSDPSRTIPNGAAAGAALHHSDPANHPALTPAEQRVVQLVAAGCANREVAATLYLSVKTVEAVLTGVYRKLGVRSRTQLCLLLNTDPHAPLVETG